MLNNIYPLIVQAAFQPQGPADPAPANPSIPAFESSALWIDDVILLYAAGY